MGAGVVGVVDVAAPRTGPSMVTPIILDVVSCFLHQLHSEHPEFPAPYARLGSGPIWTRPVIEHFASVWVRKPGRPAKAS
ncbi:hypothetical protein PA7_31790 [Pseudonocardia asaccharolytica DSM 44247 = NBRC 16224]|uniref:Uncharacterized protein n=1 Tax=Pseudonocardia asaccharolytica DSM 44247 = NBRC 16224 TaxID=1123024 RepID=A0A511D3J0_9PSEU|nr:hypothetical protein PA7_31790 [Pseudonocardia asaccharolytica DSM 44247 = NBRC 16224]